MTRMTRPNVTLLFEPRPFRTIFSACGRTVRLIYVQEIVSILLSLYFSSTKSSLNWNIWKAVFFYEKLSTNVSESDKDGWYFINSGTLDLLCKKESKACFSYFVYTCTVKSNLLYMMKVFIKLTHMHSYCVALQVLTASGELRNGSLEICEWVV